MVDLLEGIPNTTSLFAAPRVRIQTFPVYGSDRLRGPSQTRHDIFGVSSSWTVAMRLPLLPRFKQKDQRKRLFGKPLMFSRRRRKRLERGPHYYVLGEKGDF